MTLPCIFNNDQVKSILKDNNLDFLCNCAGMSFIDKDHGYISMDDLYIIKNNSWRNLICKGPKYHETKAVNFIKAKSNILKGIDKYIRSQSN